MDRFVERARLVVLILIGVLAYAVAFGGVQAVIRPGMSRGYSALEVFFHWFPIVPTDFYGAVMYAFFCLFPVVLAVLLAKGRVVLPIAVSGALGMLASGAYSLLL